MSDEFTHACKLLMRREHSEGELRRKLKARWPDSDDIEVVIGQLLEEGLLSDERFCEAFIRSRVARFQGPRKIRAELSRKLVPDHIADRSLENSGIPWRELAAQWLARQGKIAQDSDNRQYEMRAKYYRRLVNRGFTHDQAMDALQEKQCGGDGV